MKARLPLLTLLLAAAAFPCRSAEPPLRVTPPPVALHGVSSSITLAAEGQLPAAEVPIEIRDGDGAVRARGTLRAGTESTIEIGAEMSGEPLFVFVPGHYDEGLPVRTRAIAGWLTLLPPLLAIVLALLFRQVVLSLLAGVWLGASLVSGGAFTGLLRTVDTYAVGALADPDHVSIILFSLMLGGMVGVVSRSGGTFGLVEALSPYATTPRRGQLVTWLLGILVFFDDYANTLLVGNTMRPVSDRLRLSREKLAYIVDSTAAPVASIALISTWVGYEVSLIADALRTMGSERDAYSLFLQSIPYNFYPILTLVFGLMIAAGQRDFGPMLRAERRAAGGKLLEATAVPLSDFDGEALLPIEGKPRRWPNAVVPVLVVLLVTFLGLWFTGRAALAADGSAAAGGLEGIGAVFSAGDSFRALLYGSSAGALVALLMAVAQRILTLGDGVAAWIHGIKSMTVAVVILLLAWSISKVCADLNTSGFMVATLSDVLDPRLLPALSFLLAALTAFATGTSWGTMGILIPLAVPTAFGMAASAGYDAGVSQGILLGAVSSVLAGAIFGDHCSPISDTTVLSSMASACDHVDHVRTQLPYAATVAATAMVVGYLPCGYGLPPWLGLGLGALTLGLILRFLGRGRGS